MSSFGRGGGDPPGDKKFLRIFRRSRKGRSPEEMRDLKFRKGTSPLLMMLINFDDFVAMIKASINKKPN